MGIELFWRQDAKPSCLWSAGRLRQSEVRFCCSYFAARSNTPRTRGASERKVFCDTFEKWRPPSRPIQWRQSRLPLPELTQRWSWALIPVNCARHVQDWFPSSGEWRNWRSGQTEGESTSGPCIWAGISYCGSSPRRHKFQVFSLSPRYGYLRTGNERWWRSSPGSDDDGRHPWDAPERVSLCLLVSGSRLTHGRNKLRTGKKLTFVLFFLKWWSI